MHLSSTTPPYRPNTKRGRPCQRRWANLWHWQWMGKPGSSLVAYLVAYPLPNQPRRTSSNCHFTQLLGTSALLGQLVSPRFYGILHYQEFCHILWASVYIQTYNYIDDITLSDRFALENPRPKHLGYLLAYQEDSSWDRSHCHTHPGHLCRLQQNSNLWYCWGSCLTWFSNTSRRGADKGILDYWRGTQRV